MTFDPDTFEIKYKMADAAADLYVKGDGQFYIRNVAGAIDVEPAEVFDYFPNKKSILEFYYASFILRYELMIEEIDEFESYTLSEKLSNFAFTSFDMLREKEAFVEATLQHVILDSYSKTDFEKEIERLFKQFLENDPQVSITSTLVLNEYAYAFMRKQYLQLVRFWLNDSSQDKELTMELIDKLTGVVQELIYNPVLDKSFDLLKFLNSNRKAFLNNIPIVKRICSKIEIR